MTASSTVLNANQNCKHTNTNPAQPVDCPAFFKRAAVLYALFRRSGMQVELWIGVRRDSDGALAAHAWLVRDGAPYLEALEGSLPTFQVIARFPEVPGAVR